MLSYLASLVILVSIATAQSPPSDAALVAQLLTANSQVAKINDIVNDTAFVFDFLNGARGSAQGGFAVSANSVTFPALLTGNGAMTVGVMGPCGANSPHIHPRATEVQIVVQGGPIYTEFIMENGARAVKNTVPVGSATLFPKGSIHFQQNMGCEPTVFIASFDNVDPGTSQIAQNFFALDSGVVNATLGDIGVSILDHLALPSNFILGAQECLDRCKIDRSTFNFTASFADYAIFSNSTWGAAPALPSSVSAMYAPGSTAVSGKLSDLNGQSANGDSSDIPFSQNSLHGVVIGLAAVSGALLLAVAALLVSMSKSSREGVKNRANPLLSDEASSYAEPRGYPYETPYDDHAALAPNRRSEEKV